MKTAASEITRRPVTRHIFAKHCRHRVTREWQSFAKWIAAFPDSVALYRGNQFLCVR